jgi:hypothetical protein
MAKGEFVLWYHWMQVLVLPAVRAWPWSLAAAYNPAWALSYWIAISQNIDLLMWEIAAIQWSHLTRLINVGADLIFCILIKYSIEWEIGPLF